MQKTKPKKGDPVEIPVPKKKDVFDVFKRAAKGSPRRSTKG